MRPMLRRAAAAMLAIFTLASCAPDSTTPAAPAGAQGPDELLGINLGGVLDLSGISLYSCSTAGYGSVSRVIGPAGGVVAVGPHSLTIPPGALLAPTTITATAPAGKIIRVDFQPEGLRFATPTVLTLSYRECLLPPLTPRIVYLDDANVIRELLSPSLSLLTGTVSGKLGHFSGYAVGESRTLE